MLHVSTDVNKLYFRSYGINTSSLISCVANATIIIIIVYTVHQLLLHNYLCLQQLGC